MSELSVAVIGGGRWARALSMVLAQNQTKTSGRIGRVMIYRPPRDPSAPSSVLAEATLRTPSRQSMAPKKPSGGDETLQMTAAALLSAAGEVYADQIELGELPEADVLILAVHSKTVRGLLRTIKRQLRSEQILVHAIGGFAPSDNPREPGGMLISDVVQQETPIRRIGALAGPAMAEDLAESSPAALVCGSLSEETGAAARQVMGGPTLRIHLTRDRIGVEVAHASVSVVALAAGIAEAMELGASARAMLVARGASEMSQIGMVLGANDRTFVGLAGVGEMVVATERRGSGDFQLGQLLGRGIPLAEAERQVGRVCDGVAMVREGFNITQRFGLRSPILSVLYSWLVSGGDLKNSMRRLLADDSHIE